MDPDETLAAIRDHSAALLDRDLRHDEVVDHAVALAEAARDLDGWLTRGGFLPKDWERR